MLGFILFFIMYYFIISLDFRETKNGLKPVKHYSNFLCLNILVKDWAIFSPAGLKAKKASGAPFIVLWARNALKGLSSLRASGHFFNREKEKVLGNKSKHSWTNASKSHFLLLSTTEKMLKTMRLSIGTVLYKSSSKAFFMVVKPFIGNSAKR